MDNTPDLADVDTLAPIWKANALKPVNEATLLFPAGTHLEQASVSPLDISPLDGEDSHSSTATDLTPHDVMTSCGFALVRHETVSEELTAAAHRLNDHDSFGKDTRKPEDSGDLAGTYAASEMMTADMIKLDIEGYKILSKASSVNGKAAIEPSFNGTFRCDEGSAHEIYYIPGMAAAPLGLLFLAGCHIQVLRAPYEHEEEEEEEGGGGEGEDEDGSSNSDIISCLAIQDALVYNNHQKDNARCEGSLCAVSGALKTKLEGLDNETWTTLRVQKYDVLSCVRGTLFRFILQNGPVFGKVLSAIRSPVSSDASGIEKYNRLLEMRVALATGHVNPKRWGTPRCGELPPEKLETTPALELLKLMRHSSNEEHVLPAEDYLTPPFHRFTTDRCWSAGFPEKFAKRYNNILRFAALAIQCDDTIANATKLNEEALKIQKTPLVTPGKIKELENTYSGQKNKWLKDNSLQLGPLTNKLALINKKCTEGAAELKRLQKNLAELKTLSGEIEELRKQVTDAGFTNKKLAMSLSSADRKKSDAEKLPSDSRIKNVRTAIVIIEKALKQATDTRKKHNDKKARQQQARQEQEAKKREREAEKATKAKEAPKLPDPETFKPPADILQGVPLQNWIQKTFTRANKYSNRHSLARKAEKLQRRVAQAPEMIASLEMAGEDVPEKMRSLAETKLTEEQIKEAALFEEGKYGEALAQVAILYAAASEVSTAGGEYDIAACDWILDRLEFWPQHPFIAVNEGKGGEGLKKKYGQLTLYGKLTAPPERITDCPNDPECENTTLLSHHAMKAARLSHPCLVCHTNRLYGEVNKKWAKISSAYETGDPRLNELAEKGRWEKMQTYVLKLEKWYDKVIDCPAVQRTGALPQSWKDFQKNLKVFNECVAALPVDELPEVVGGYGNQARDENWVPEMEQYNNEACVQCGGLVIEGVCGDCLTDNQDAREKKTRRKKRKRDQDKEEEEEEESGEQSVIINSESDEDESDEQDEDEEEEVGQVRKRHDTKGRLKNGRARKREKNVPLETVEDHIQHAIDAAKDPIVLATLESALKRAKHKDIVTENRVSPFVCINQVEENGEFVFDKTTAKRFGNRTFATTDEAVNHAASAWGYTEKTHSYMFFAEIPISSRPTTELEN